MIRSVFTGLLIACSLGSGCDDVPAPPAELVAERLPTQSIPTRPTTRELLTGPRKRLSLGALPLSVHAPAGWHVNPVEGTNVVLLEGPTPAGEVHVQLTSRAMTSGEKLEALVSGAQRELKQNPDSMRVAELRTVGSAKVLERQRIGRVPKTNLTEEEVAKPSPTFSWTMTFFIPRDADYETYELNFIGLTADQYETDKALLHEIMDSVTVDSPAVDSGATHPATAGATIPPK